jgi:hypothetical protein
MGEPPLVFLKGHNNEMGFSIFDINRFFKGIGGQWALGIVTASSNGYFVTRCRGKKD